MKNKLPSYSLKLGVTVWLVSLVGLTYLNLFYSVKNPNPHNIFKPGAFESLLIILTGAAFTSVGLLSGLIGLKILNNTKHSWAGIIVNGLYCIPIGVILLMQILR